MPIVFIMILLGSGVLIGLYHYVAHVGGAWIVDPSVAPVVEAIIIPGAKVEADGRPSDMLRDRLDVALALYNMGRANAILVSGDGREQSGNETKNMAAYLIERGVPEAAILIDAAGFDTFQTVLRAKTVFNVETAIMTTQTFHLERALYISEKLGLQMTGVASDIRSYQSMLKMTLRELGARVKAIYEVNTFRDPAISG